MSEIVPAGDKTTSSQSAQEAKRAAIRARLRAQIDVEARGKVAEDEVLALVQHGLHKHQRQERQNKARVRKERLQLVEKAEEKKPHLVPKWLRDNRKTVKVDLSVESDECNLVCPVCNDFLFFPEPAKLSDLAVEFLPCTHAIHVQCRVGLQKSRPKEKLMCAICLKPMDRNDFMWTGKLSDSEADSDSD